jgi:hypothetical protein
VSSAALISCITGIEIFEGLRILGCSGPPPTQSFRGVSAHHHQLSNHHWTKVHFFFRGLLPPPPPIRQYRRTKVRHFFLFINQLTTTKVTTTLENEQIFEVIFPSITAHQMTTPHQPAPSNRARMLVSRLPTHHNQGFCPPPLDCPPDSTSVQRCATVFFLFISTIN